MFNNLITNQNYKLSYLLGAERGLERERSCRRGGGDLLGRRLGGVLRDGGDLARLPGGGVLHIPKNQNEEYWLAQQITAIQ